MDRPAAEIQVKAQKLRVFTRQATGQEYDRLWDYVTSQRFFYVSYQQRTQRKIPVVILEPEP